MLVKGTVSTVLNNTYIYIKVKTKVLSGIGAFSIGSMDKYEYNK